MTEPAAYRVLARKYRPTTFADLIGQEAMVRTLRNAIASGRLAHAFVLTGVRGIGKTTTARIIARALNCAEGPTDKPCGICIHCTSIAEDRHVDVLEMDAASRTGVNDIREIIEGVRYRPTQARFKIYIIDEVHMLSTAAFNALLKTLEEPPEHVKFIFATTEIRKVPITVLSRCQRFDLKRVDSEMLAAHFANIAENEGATADAGALALIARAADGSVRDGLSLLDQAISHGAGLVSEAQVRDMLGLADRARVFDLFELVMKGEMPQALDLLGQSYASGADPAVVLEDMLELVHWLTRVKLAPQLAEAPGVAEAERVRGKSMATALSMAALTKSWQLLLKGLGETRNAPSPLSAAEMVLIRLAFAADLPSPADAVESVKRNPPQPPAQNISLPPSGGGARAVAGGGTSYEAAPAPQAQAHLPMPQTFAETVALFAERQEPVLHAHLQASVNLVHFEPGRIEINPMAHAPKDLANRAGALLTEWTGKRWVVSISNKQGAETLRGQELEQVAKQKADAARHPLVQAVLAAFPDASIEAVRSAPTPEAAPVVFDTMSDMPNQDEDL
ncbi:MAG: DNA polymerase III subunit gamma/tau [Alphaproteobacteria bacterium]|nr:DNA polymerase III subunit gamma/tau [Alphaproteobacteria bacterium]